jgi:hypothetical protein
MHQLQKKTVNEKCDKQDKILAENISCSHFHQTKYHITEYTDTLIRGKNCDINLKKKKIHC